MDANNRAMLIKLFEWNKSGLITDEDFAKLSKALLYENMTQKEIENKNREEKKFETRQHTEELRERVNEIKAKRTKKQKIIKDRLYLSIVLDRYGDRAFTLETIKNFSDDDVIELAEEIRENNHNPKFKLLNENEQQQFLDLFVPEKEKDEFKFDYKFPKPSWMIFNNNIAKSNELTSTEKEEKKKEIANRLFKESVEKDKTRQENKKSGNKDNIYVLPGKKNFDVNKVADIVNDKKDRTRDISNLASFDNKTNNKNIDRTSDVENMAKYSDKVETKESSRYVKSIKNVGSKIKNHSKIIAGGAMAVASLAAVILNPAFVLAIPAGAVIGYAGKQIYDGRKGK